MKDILAPAKDWSGGTWAERIDQCRSMLFCHGYIPMSVNDRIFAKLKSQYASAIEARRAADSEAGTVGDESATAKPDAQTGEG